MKRRMFLRSAGAALLYVPVTRIITACGQESSGSYLLGPGDDKYVMMQNLILRDGLREDPLTPKQMNALGRKQVKEVQVKFIEEHGGVHHMIPFTYEDYKKVVLAHLRADQEEVEVEFEIENIKTTEVASHRHDVSISHKDIDESSKYSEVYVDPELLKLI